MKHKPFISSFKAQNKEEGKFQSCLTQSWKETKDKPFVESRKDEIQRNPNLKSAITKAKI